MSKPLVYIAGPWTERDRVRRVIQTLGQYFRVTHDWTGEPGAGKDDPTGSYLEEAQRRQAADADFRGVETADHLLILYPETGGQGLFIEFGIALALSIPVYLVALDLRSDPPCRTIFEDLPGVWCCGSLTEAVELILEVDEEAA